MRRLTIAGFAAAFAAGLYLCYGRHMDAGPRRDAALYQIGTLGIEISRHDGDPAAFPAPTLPAIDPWGTPLAVIGGSAVTVNGQVVSRDESGPWKGWSHQIISAGPDRIFGTADDIRSFDDPTR